MKKWIARSLILAAIILAAYVVFGRGPEWGKDHEVVSCLCLGPVMLAAAVGCMLLIGLVWWVIDTAFTE